MTPGDPRGLIFVRSLGEWVGAFARYPLSNRGDSNDVGPRIFQDRAT